MPKYDLYDELLYKFMFLFLPLTLNRMLSAEPLIPVRYDRNYLLQLQFAPESLQKPSGLPVLPEIILNAVGSAYHTYLFLDLHFNEIIPPYQLFCK